MRSLLGVGDAVGSVLDALEDAHEMEDTFVVFVSNNGLLLGEHRKVGKNVPYEESIRVPLVVIGPGVVSGGTTDELALNIDLAPTILEIAGVRASTPIDGRSLLPILRGARPASWRSDFLVEKLDGLSEEISRGKGTNRPSYSALRTKRYAYVEYAGGPEGAREMYDLEKDPYVLQSLNDRPEMADLMARLSRRLAALKSCRARTCRQAAPAGQP